MKKAALNFLCLVGVYHPNLVFVEERSDLHTVAIAANKRANSQLLHKNLNLFTITFLAVYSMNRGNFSYMN